jgi:hypothetical protein
VITEALPLSDANAPRKKSYRDPLNVLAKYTPGVPMFTWASMISGIFGTTRFSV